MSAWTDLGEKLLEHGICGFALMIQMLINYYTVRDWHRLLQDHLNRQTQANYYSDGR